MSEKDLSYGTDKISALSGLEPIRSSPGMFISTTTAPNGPNSLVFEGIDNVLDEFIVGYGKNVWVYINKDDSVKIEDEARGVPVGLSKTIKDENGKPMNTLTAVCTRMNAGGKFRGRGSAYRFSSGIHGLGIKCISSLSEYMYVTVKRDGNIYQQKFSRGIPITDVEVIGHTNETGTTIEYKPDYEIFKSGLSTDDKVRRRLMELASLNAGFIAHYNNEKVKQNVTYCFEDGIVGLVNDMVETKPKLFNNAFHFSGEYTYKLSILDKNGKIVESDDEDTILCDIAFIYTDESEQSGKIKVFANNINTYEGGTHLTGFKNIIKTKMNEYALQRKLTKKPVELMYWLDGLYAVVSVKISNPEFESQTKIKLNNSEAQDAVEKVVGDYFDKLFKDKSKQPILDAIAQHAIRVKEAEEAARRAKAIKRTSKAASKQALPGKLADCANSANGDYAEIFLCEGNSASGCLIGHTLIHLADGRDVSIEQLVEEFNQGKTNYVFSMNNDTKDIAVQPIQDAFCTKEVTELIKITLDNGEIIQCTPEHPFLCANGNYVEAKNLVVNQSLMPLYSKISGSAKVHSMPINDGGSRNGYEYIVIHGKYVPVHRLVATQYYGKKEKGFHTHHIDINSRNNNPENLQYLPKKEHLAIHMKLINDEYHYDFRNCSEEFHKAAIEASIIARREHPEWKDKHKASLKKYHDEHPEWKENLSVKAKQQWEDEELRAWRAEKTKEQLKLQKETGKFEKINKRRKETLQRKKETGEFDKIYEKSRNTIKETTIERLKQYIIFLKEKYSIVPNTKKLYLEHITEYNQGKSRNESAPQWQTFRNIFPGDKRKEFLDTINHQIVSIKHIILDKPVKVYDLTVPPYNNFALSSGVFVHNSAKSGRQPSFQAILPLRGKVLNVEKVSIDKMLKAPSVQTIISALGCGVGKTFDVTKCRYDKILIACFTGDTRIKLLNGTMPTFEELVQMEQDNPGQSYWVYSIDENGNIVPGEAVNPRITRYEDTLYEVILDNNSSVRCTGDHLFMLRDGTYCRADELISGMSLMPLYTRHSRLEDKIHMIGREEVFDKTKWKFTHRVIGNALYDIEEKIIHHIDGNYLNNSPDNLQCLTAKEHYDIHLKSDERRELSSKIFIGYNKSQKNKDTTVALNQREDVKILQMRGRIKKQLAVLIRLGYTKEMFDAEDKLLFSHLAKKFSFESIDKYYQNKNDAWDAAVEYEKNNLTTEEFKGRLSSVKKYNKKLKEAKQTKQTSMVRIGNFVLSDGNELNAENYKKKVQELHAKVPSYELWSKYFNSKEEFIEACKNYNHKVKEVRIIHLDNSVPVYDITVKKYHNFAVVYSQEGEFDNGFIDSQGYKATTTFCHNCDADVDG